MKAAVVIPVHADPAGLQRTLASLSGALGEQSVVVVVVDGPHVATEQVAREMGAVVVVIPESQGSYAARNAGVAALDDDVEAVLFTDAGCVVLPGWVEAHVAALGQVELSGGSVRMTFGARPSPAEWVDTCRNLRQQAYVEKAGYAATCNLAVRRDLVARLLFDGRLQSGGDREFCDRATAAGATLVYSPAAVVEHPARRTPKEVLAKARRVGRGLAALPAASRAVPTPPRRPDRGLARRARESGVMTGALWTARVALLDYRRASILYREATRSAPVEGLHVVVLLGSRWSALEQMNTRWRRVVQEWVDHPAVAHVTLVDHPQFRRRALRLAHRTGSWLPGVDVLNLTVPTKMRPGPLDRLAWWRCGLAVRRALPEASQRLVVSASPVNSPLLSRLAGPRTTLAFDAVDVWRYLALRGDLGARLAAGYPSVSAAQRLSAVSTPIAESLARWTAAPVQVVPNGVDVQIYQGPPGQQPAPDGLPERPFAVYVGSLSSRFDVEFTGRVAGILGPEVPIVLAGPADSRTAARLAQLPVMWLGPVPTTLVPGLLQRAAVGLFPHRSTDITEAIDSMKMLEYAAAGLPVVSTELPGLPPGAVAAVDAEAFAREVLAAVSLPRRTQPLEWVLERDWSTVADRLLAALLPGHPAAAPEAVLR